MDNRTTEERFWARVSTSSDVTACWPWTGGRDKDGYGKFSAEGKDKRAHVYAWEREHGPVAPGLCVCHRCDHPWCCNAEHYFIGTRGENTADCCSKGRASSGRGESHGHAKLTWEDVRLIRSLAGTASQERLGREFGVRQSVVSMILSHKIWREAA